MYEGNYCQHKALKPADFKLNGAVLWCLRHSGDVASCGVDRVQWPGLEHPGPHSAPTAKHIAQLAGSYTEPWEPICSCSGLFGKKKCLDNHHIGIKWKPPQKRKIQSAQSREAISTCGHTLSPCFTPKSMTFIVHISTELGLCCSRVIHITIVLPFARVKGKNRNVFTYKDRLLVSSWSIHLLLSVNPWKKLPL